MDVAHLFFRGFNFNSHDRLKQNRAGIAHTFFESHRTGHLEGVFVRVHFMVRTEVECCLNVNNRVTGQNTGLHGVFDTLLNGRNVFAGNNTALDSIDELVALAGVRFELQNNVAVLTTAAGLLNKLSFGVLNSRTDGFTVAT